MSSECAVWEMRGKAEEVPGVREHPEPEWESPNQIVRVALFA